MTADFVELPRTSNQARGIAEYAREFLATTNPGPSVAVLQMAQRFHLDSVACGVSALLVTAAG